MTTTTIPTSPSTFPLIEMLHCNFWAAISPAARAVLAVIWNYYRLYPDACHPSRLTLAKEAGVSEPTVTRAIKELASTGLLQVLPAPGPGANTYRLDWSAICIPEKRKAKSKAGSPYAPPSAVHEVTLVQDAHGGGHEVRNRKDFGYALPDGCYVRSAAEVTIHSYLTEWRVPHWANVNYQALGIKGLHPQATADFVVGPGLLVEHFGLPRIQGQAAKYNKKRKEKEQAINRAGWKLIAVEAGEATLNENHLKRILEAWGNACIEDAQKLKHGLDLAGAWQPAHPSCQLLELHIADATSRRCGDKPPRYFTAMTKVVVGRNGIEEYHSVKPELVLETNAGVLGPVRIPAKDASIIGPLDSRDADLSEEMKVAPPTDEDALGDWDDWFDLGERPDREVEQLRADIERYEALVADAKPGSRDHMDAMDELNYVKTKLAGILDRRKGDDS